jgi:SAM-dependent methyltransferase
MITPSYDRDFWEQLWSRTLRERADDVARRPPNAHLTDEATGLRPGLALDAGCGHGSDALWLAAHGWQVTAVDFSTAALAHARSTAEAAGADVAGRVDWVEADLASWIPQPRHYDLVACLCGGWEQESRRAELCCWSGTARSTRTRAPQRPRPVKCRSRSKLRSPRSITLSGTSTSPKTALGPRRAPASTP